jgi:hypothetical protein
MRQWISLVVMGPFLLSLAGCARDSMKAPAEPAPTTIAQAPSSPAELPTSTEQPSEEVQERAVGPALSQKTPPDTKVQPLLPGHFAFKTFYGYWVTAVGGGGKTSDAFHTDAVKADRWEWFGLYKCGDLGSGYQYA